MRQGHLPQALVKTTGISQASRSEGHSAGSHSPGSGKVLAKRQGLKATQQARLHQALATSTANVKVCRPLGMVTCFRLWLRLCLTSRSEDHSAGSPSPSSCHIHCQTSRSASHSTGSPAPGSGQTHCHQPTSRSEGISRVTSSRPWSKRSATRKV